VNLTVPLVVRLEGTNVALGKKILADSGLPIISGRNMADAAAKVVKAAPAVRRAYLDRALARLLPGRADVPVEYLTALGQRNAALRRVAAGLADASAIEPWTAQVVARGESLVAARHETIDLLAPGFAGISGELGLAGGELEYVGEPPSQALFDSRLARDLERGTTGVGPHLDDVAIRAVDRDLRTFGSQGEQRVAVLALLLSEAEALRDRRGVAPLVLLDDVLSELDGTRRANLADHLAQLGQAVVTATGPEALPLEPRQLLEVTPGRVRAAA